MQKTGTRGKRGAFLGLLLLTLGLGLPGSFAHRPGGHPQSNGTHGFFAAGGDVPEPGAYGFSGEPVKVLHVLERAGIRPGEWDLKGVPVGSVLEPGTCVLFRALEKTASIRLEPMDAFTRMTLGMKIPINQATAEELTALPGVGHVLAAHIVKHRDTRGRFEKESDLLGVPGIGRNTLNRLMPYVLLE